jgi:hypothetical protein
MRSFKHFIVEKEISEFALDLEQFDMLRENVEPAEIAVDAPETPKPGVPHGRQPGSNIWKKVSKGAKKYFDASPEEQASMQKEADRVLGKTKLLGDEASNPKLTKSGNIVPEYNTKGLSFAPSTKSGIDVCPASTEECRSACLGTEAGRGRMQSVRDARVNRTHKLFDHPHLFFAKLDGEFTSAKKSDAKNGQRTASRLNVLSDIPYEHLAPQLFKKHKDIAFYDYTKISGRLNHKNLPSNYHLTLSSTGINHETSNWKDVREHLDRGGVASMVFKIPSKTKNKQPLPSHVHDEETGKKYVVVDGDEHDHRHLDHIISNIPKGQGVIAGLRIKGGSRTATKAGKFAVPVENGVAVARKGEN